MVKGEEGEALYRYENPKADLKKYSKIMIDPVILSKAAISDATETENYQKLGNNAFVYLDDELKKDYTVVTTPEPGAVRVQMGIIAADSTSSVKTVLSTIMPICLGISIVKYAATGTPMSVGDITVELEITDAVSGELLGAARPLTSGRPTCFARSGARPKAESSHESIINTTPASGSWRCPSALQLPELRDAEMFFSADKEIRLELGVVLTSMKHQCKCVLPALQFTSINTPSRDFCQNNKEETPCNSSGVS